MRERLLVDTSILVSALDSREEWAAWTVGKMKSISGTMYTCEAVLAESWYILRKRPLAWKSITKWIDAGYLQVQSPMKKHSSSVLDLMKKYKDLPMSLADACLVAMVENDLGDRVFTLDHHFKIYRHSGRRIVPVLMPEKN